MTHPTNEPEPERVLLGDLCGVLEGATHNGLCLPCALIKERGGDTNPDCPTPGCGDTTR